MTLTQLKYIIALDDYRNFAAAAEHCFVAQPTLSLQVKKLEQSLNVELFDRSKVPLSPTEAGRHFIRQARQVMQEVDKLNGLTSGQTQHVQSKLSIGIIPTLACYLLGDLVTEIEKNFPNLDLWIKELPTAQILDQIEQNKIELGLVALPIKLKNIREKALYYEPMVAYGSAKTQLPRNYVTVDALRDHPIILLGDDHCFRNQSLKICGHAAKSQIQCNSLETLIEMVRIKQAATLIPQRYAEIHGLETVSFKKPRPSRTIGWVTKKTFFKDEMIELIENSLKTLIPKHYFNKIDKKMLGLELSQ